MLIVGGVMIRDLLRYGVWGHWCDCCYRPLVLGTTRLWCLTCTVPAAAWPDAPEGASSCDPLNCSCWWLQNHSCNTCGTQRDNMKQSSNMMGKKGSQWFCVSTRLSPFPFTLVWLWWYLGYRMYTSIKINTSILSLLLRFINTQVHFSTNSISNVPPCGESMSPLSWQPCCKDTLLLLPSSLRDIETWLDRISTKHLKRVVQAFIAPRLDCWNSWWAGFIQSSLSHLLTGAKRTDPITLVLSSLHWFSVLFKTESKNHIDCV